MTFEIQKQPLCHYIKKMLVNFDLNVSSKSLQNHEEFYFFIFCDMFFSSTNFLLHFSDHIQARCVCALVCLSSAFATKQLFFVKIISQMIGNSNKTP